MIYWRIKQPGKSWRNWSDGIADDVKEARESAIESLMSYDDQVPAWAEMGVNIEMYQMTDIDDVRLTAKEMREHWGAITA